MKLGVQYEVCAAYTGARSRKKHEDSPETVDEATLTTTLRIQGEASIVQCIHSDIM